MEPFLIADHFQSDILHILVIKCSDDTAKATLTYDFKHFVAISDVIMCNVDVGAGCIVETEILVSNVGASLHATLVWIGSDKVNLRIEKDLRCFIFG